MPETVDITWSDVRSFAQNVAGQLWSVAPKPGAFGLYAYPIPRGGIPAAMAIAIAATLQKGGLRLLLTEVPSEADLFIDDVIDSGRTRNHFAIKYPSVPFLALLRKNIRDPKWYVWPWERMSGEGSGPTENIRRLIEYIGDDPNRDGLKDTPDRVIRSYSELFSGYKVDSESLFKTFEDIDCDEMILLRNAEFFSTCEHHMLPFYGRAHVAYIPKTVEYVPPSSPNGTSSTTPLTPKIIGVSKLARILDCFARRLTIQERICTQVTACIEDNMPGGVEGAACVIEAKHHCMCSRGVSKQHSEMVTSSLTGKFRHPEVRQELFSLIGK